MKKTLIIIGAVFAGIIMLAIVGSFLPSDEPQKVIVVQETTAPEPVQETPEPTPMFNSDEQQVYDFIATSYPTVKRLWTHTNDAIESGRDVAAINALADDGIAFTKVVKRWNNLDFVSGQVGTLEANFDEYMNAVRAYYKNWLNGISGGNIDQCAANAVKATFKIKRWGPRVKSELQDLKQLTYQ